MPNDNESKEQLYIKRLNKIQTLVMIGLIGGPVSLLIGGFPLSIATLVCSFIAFFDLGRIDAKKKLEGSIERRLYFQSVAAVVICVMASILNGIFFINLMTMLMDAYNSGSLDSLLDTVVQGSDYGQSGSLWNR